MSAPPVAAAFLRTASRHDFFLALRRLQAGMGGPPIGTAPTLAQEQVRLMHQPSLSFGGDAISGARWNEQQRRLDMSLRFSGLLGPNGPMPLHLTEYVLDRLVHEKDGTLAAFLDVFHHRFYSLLFRAWALNQPTVALEEAGAQRHVQYLRCLIGLGTAGSTGRDSVPDTAWVYYSGGLGGLGRSPSGLAAILRDYFAVPAEVRSFEAMWLTLPADSRCRLGWSRATGVLGQNCFAGEQVRVAHLKFLIRFGPLTWGQYQTLLPGGRAFRQVAEWVRAYVGDELYWEVQLVLRPEEVPECRLGGGVRLGWSTWLGAAGRSPRPRDDLILPAA